MQQSQSLTAALCRDLTPRMFAVNHGAGEKLAAEIQRLLDPIQSDSFHCWVLTKDRATTLHYHDRDEYWAWLKGRTLLQIRLPDGRSEEFEIGPGWIVYCLRGVEHGHTPLEDWACFEWVGREQVGARPGHLTRTFDS
ncbi:MAG: hypothetical protein HYV35_02640 [Lentisphaerae bacterium]|nr:hypothetical protein [Lentisphaerota bacterium]